MKIWAAILLITLITFLERSSFIVWFQRFSLPSWVEQALRYVPAAAFYAIIAPTILRTDGTLDISPLNIKLLAALIAGVVVYRGHGILWTIVSGMGALWILQWLL